MKKELFNACYYWMIHWWLNWKVVVKAPNALHKSSGMIRAKLSNWTINPRLNWKLVLKALNALNKTFGMVTAKFNGVVSSTEAFTISPVKTPAIATRAQQGRKNENLRQRKRKPKDQNVSILALVLPLAKVLLKYFFSLWLCLRR